MKTTLATITLLGAALLFAGCSRTPIEPAARPMAEPHAVPATLPDPQEPPPPLVTANDTAVSAKPVDGVKAVPEEREPSAEKAETKDAPTDKPTVLKAVGRALLKSLTSDSGQTPPSRAPAFQPQR